MVQLISMETLDNQVTIGRLKSLEELMSLEDIGGNKPGYDPSSYNYKFTILKQLEWLKWYLTNYPNGVGFTYYNGDIEGSSISVNDVNIIKFGPNRDISPGDLIISSSGILYGVTDVSNDVITLQELITLKGVSVVSATVTRI